MGMSLTVDLGVGISIPVDEEEERLKLPEFKSIEGWIVPYPIDEDDDEQRELLYDFFEFLGEKFDLLSFDAAYSYEYVLGGAIFVKRLSTSGYHDSAELDTDINISIKEIDQLSAAAKLLGLEYNPKIIALPSYG